MEKKRVHNIHQQSCMYKKIHLYTTAEDVQKMLTDHNFSHGHIYFDSRTLQYVFKSSPHRDKNRDKNNQKQK